jgi:DNA-binding GntR family transcriptional regulator
MQSGLTLLGSSRLAQRLAERILADLRDAGAQPGAHLAEQPLADRLKVSRSPVREALTLLAGAGVVERRPNRGFFLACDASALPEAAPASAAPEPDEALYQRLVEDRLAGALPDRVSERALARRYAVARGRLLTLLKRAEAEGWAERLPGRGWGFPPVIDSPEAYEAGYRYRLIIEPAAMLEPGFRPDPAVFRRLRAEQEALLGGGARMLSRAELFAVTSGFHEGLIALSGNPLLLDGLRRVNRLRRLVEYRLYADVERLARMAADHLRILDLIEQDEREAAAALMRTHLRRSRDARRGAIGQHATGNASR